MLLGKENRQARYYHVRFLSNGPGKDREARAFPLAPSEPAFLCELCASTAIFAGNSFLTAEDVQATPKTRRKPLLAAAALAIL